MIATQTPQQPDICTHSCFGHNSVGCNCNFCTGTHVCGETVHFPTPKRRKDDLTPEQFLRREFTVIATGLAHKILSPQEAVDLLMVVVQFQGMR